MIFEIISGGEKLTGWGKNGPAYFFPGERMGRPILSPGKKLTGGKFWPVTPGCFVLHSYCPTRVNRGFMGWIYPGGYLSIYLYLPIHLNPRRGRQTGIPEYQVLRGLVEIK